MTEPPPGQVGGSDFPTGLRVVIVDDDPVCLRTITETCKRCNYNVTSFACALEALAHLRANSRQVDLVLSDVHMPNMDGFKFLVHIGLEIDLPVIMMSSNGSTEVVLRGITHGAVDYLIKPIRLEEVRNIWQHVIRRRQEPSQDASPPDPADSKPTKRKTNGQGKGDEGKETVPAKKPRVVWSAELHQKFVDAVNQLGIDKAMPKKILALMGVSGLTRDNIASHLQKYRLLFLKRLTPTQGGAQGLPMGATGLVDHKGKVASAPDQQMDALHFPGFAHDGGGNGMAGNPMMGQMHHHPAQLGMGMGMGMGQSLDSNTLLKAMAESSRLLGGLGGLNAMVPGGMPAYMPQGFIPNQQLQFDPRVAQGLNGMYMPTTNAATTPGFFNAGAPKDPVAGFSASVPENTFGEMTHTDMGDIIPTGVTTVIGMETLAGNPHVYRWCGM